ncbi:MAG: primosomal protein N', partial [Bacteroidales bacterium]
MADLYADIILPLAVRNYYTYRVPEPFRERAGPGIRVIVPFGAKKLYTGIIRRVHNDRPEYQNIKDITDVIDIEPVVNETQLKFL